MTHIPAERRARLTEGAPAQGGEPRDRVGEMGFMCTPRLGRRWNDVDFHLTPYLLCVHYTVSVFICPCQREIKTSISEMSLEDCRGLTCSFLFFCIIMNNPSLQIFNCDYFTTLSVF